MNERPLLPNLAIAFFAYFAIALIGLHFLRPDYTPVDHMISDYAVGRFGWIMTTAFISVSLGCLCLAIGLGRDGPKTVLVAIARVLMGIASLGLLVTAAFQTDLETVMVNTTHGNIHTLSFLVNIVSLFLAALSLSVSMGADAHWKSLRTPALILVAALAIAFVAQAMTLHRGAPYGITNRIFVVVLISWLMLIAVRLRTVSSLPRTV